jgi:hypothetical protein
MSRQKYFLPKFFAPDGGWRCAAAAIAGDSGESCSTHFKCNVTVPSETVGAPTIARIISNDSMHEFLPKNPASEDSPETSVCT